MDHEFLSIVEKLAILEGRIAPKDNVIAETATKQKKPALFNNLKRDESAIPMVGGVEFAEDKMEEDVLSKVKNSLADYLKSAEEQIKQDRDLIAKKKQDLDLKKKELRDLELQVNQQEVDEAIPMTLEDHQRLEAGDRVMVTGPNHYEGEFAEVAELSPSGKFVVVKFDNGDEASMHISDVEFHDDQEDVEDWEDDEHDAVWDLQHGKELDEEPNQTPPTGEAPAGETDPTYAQGSNSTYAESMTAPVRTMNVPLDEMGGSVLVEIHGDERDGFCIKRAGKELPTKFATLAEAEMALEMYNAHRAEKLASEQSTDYIEEK
jgi:hypothetical protein